MVTLFNRIGAGQGLRYVTGVPEVIGGLLVLWPPTAVWGAGVLACVMVGAVYTHLVLLGGSPVPALLLLALALALAWLRRPSAD